MLAAMLLVCVVGQAPVQAQELVPDPEWQGFKAKPGEVATVLVPKGSVFGGTDVFAFYEGMKFLKAQDETGFNALTTRGRVVELSSGTSVKVIKVTPGLDDIPYVAEVRILDGPHKDQALHVSPFWLAKMIPADQAAAKKAAADKASAEATARFERAGAEAIADLRRMQAGTPVAPAEPPGRRAEMDRLERYLRDEMPNGQRASASRPKSAGPYVKTVPKPPGSARELLDRGEALEATDPELARLYYLATVKGWGKTSQAAKAKGHLRTMPPAPTRPGQGPRGPGGRGGSGVSR